MQLVNKDLFQVQYIYSVEPSLAWGFVPNRDAALLDTSC